MFENRSHNVLAISKDSIDDGYSKAMHMVVVVF